MATGVTHGRPIGLKVAEVLDAVFASFPGQVEGSCCILEESGNDASGVVMLGARLLRQKGYKR
jgi:hypothetical protein